jgi:two-component system, chemotaxis family, chemotaxis protein CheY
MNKMKILMIEDSAFERKSISIILKDSGYSNILEAENGMDGINLYKKEKPDVVLLDLRMPGTPAGLGVFRELKKIDSKVKCIVVSIVRDKDTINDALRLGIKSYISKPISKEKLLPELKKLEK